MINSQIINQALLLNVVSKWFPSLTQSRWRFVVGAMMRLTWIAAHTHICDWVAHIECNDTNLLCHIYKSSMEFFKPYGDIFKYGTSLFADLLNWMDQQTNMEAMEERIVERIEGRLDRIEGRLDRIEGRLDRIENHVFNEHLMPLTNDDVIPEDPYHRTLYLRNRGHRV